MLISAFSAEAQRYRFEPQPTRGMVRVMFEGGGLGLGCDLTNAGGTYRYRPLGNIEFGYLLYNTLVLGLYAGIGSMNAQLDQTLAGNNFYWAGLNTEYRIPVRRSPVAPFVFIRLGGILAKPYTSMNDLRTDFKQQGAFCYGAGLGIEYVYRAMLGVRLQGGSVLTTSDRLDGIESGNQNDGVSFLSLGVSYYFSLSRYRR